MGLMKAPSILTLLVAIVLAATAVTTYLGLVAIPFVGLASFWILFGAFALLTLGTVTRGF